MKSRFLVPMLMVALVSPVLMAEPAFAQGSGDPVTDVARQRYADGVKAYDAGRWEDARAAFLQTYALKRHPAVLLNLGQSELRAGYAVDAGNHLQQFLREHKDATPAQQQAAEGGIAEAKKRAPYVIVLVDGNGADVSMDGSLVGSSPIVDPIFVKPGSHTFVATLGNKSTTQAVDAKVGPAIAVNLTLGVSGGVAPMPAPGPAPAPAAPPPDQPPPMQPGFTFGNTGPGGQPDSSSGDREPFFDWYTRKPLAWVGTGVTVIGLGLGVGFSLAAGSASSAADGHSADIRREAEKDGIDQPCGLADSDAQDVPKYQSACNTLRDDLSDYDTDIAVATVGWVAFGVGLVGTTAYILLDWLPSKKQTGEAAPTSEIAVLPILSPTQRGVGVVGTF